MKNNSKIQLLALIFTFLFSFGAKSQCNANFSYVINSNGNVSFTNLSTAASTINTLYYWNFGDNQTVYQNSPSHTYGGNGTYVVTLFLNDSITPCSSTISQTITISNSVCSLNAGFTSTISSNGLVHFYNTSTGTIPSTSYTLNFGDGNNAYYTNNSLNMASHTYTANGTYLAILYAQNSASCVSTYSAVVNLTIQPCTLAAGFTYTINNGTVNFSNTTTGASPSALYYWNFGNSNTSYGQNPSTQTYPSNGQYLVTLSVNDSINSNCNSSYTQTITLTNAPCLVSSNFSMQKDSSITSSIVWNAYPSYPSNVSSVTWNWGDNSSSTGLYPSHTYSAAGYYNICLTVSVSCGSSTTTCLNTNIVRTNNSQQMVTVNVISSLPTGIVKNNAPVDLRIFPNPAKDVLNIENTNSDFNVTVIDLFGKVVYNKAHTVNESKIDLQNFNTGIYFVKIAADNYSKTIKLIKE